MRTTTSGPRIAGFALTLGLIALASIHGQPAPRGPEFQINTFTPDVQAGPRAATTSTGFVVVWVSDNQDGAGLGVMGRRLDLDGSLLGVEFQVNTYTSSSQISHELSASASGFVVVWQSNGQDGGGAGVFGRRFDSQGNRQGVEFQVDLETVGEQLSPAVALDATGFVVVWRSGNAADSEIRFRLYDPFGEPKTSPIAVSTLATGTQTLPAVASDGGGNFVVVWNGNLDGSSDGIRARRFTSYGNPQGIEFQVNVFTPGQQFAAQVARDAAGFVVVWESYGEDGSEQGVFGRRYDSAGAPTTGDIQLNAFTLGQQRLPVVALQSGGFVATWQSYQEDGSGFGAFVRRFSTTGVALTGDVQANTTIDQNQGQVGVATIGSRFVVVWASQVQDGSQYGTFGQIFRDREFTLDVDGDGAVQPLTDALLILRYAFGFRGAVLITGTVGASCTRCDASAIEDYLAGEV